MTMFVKQGGSLFKKKYNFLRNLFTFNTSVDEPFNEIGVKTKIAKNKTENLKNEHPIDCHGHLNNG